MKIVKPRRLFLVDPWIHYTGAQYSEAWFGGKAKGGQGSMDAIHDGVAKQFASEIASGQVTIVRFVCVEHSFPHIAATFS